MAPPRKRTRRAERGTQIKMGRTWGGWWLVEEGRGGDEGVVWSVADEEVVDDEEEAERERGSAEVDCGVGDIVAVGGGEG